MGRNNMMLRCLIETEYLCDIIDRRDSEADKIFANFRKLRRIILSIMRYVYNQWTKIMVTYAVQWNHNRRRSS